MGWDCRFAISIRASDRAAYNAAREFLEGKCAGFGYGCSVLFGYEEEVAEDPEGLTFRIRGVSNNRVDFGVLNELLGVVAGLRVRVRYRDGDVYEVKARSGESLGVPW